MLTINKQVATEPFKTRSNEVKVVKGFAESSTRDSLIPLKVVFDASEDKDMFPCIVAGSTIYVRSEMSLQSTAKKVYKVNDIEFVLIPLDLIVMVEEAELPRPDKDLGIG